MEAIKMARRLTLEETEKCLKAWRELKDKDALTLLTVCNSGLVGFFAKKYIGNGLTFDELVSAGNEGLIRTINKFDYQEGEIQAFRSYMAIAIENSMKNELKKYHKHSHVLSYDQPIRESKDGDELTLKDIIGSDADELEKNVISKMKNDVVREALKTLTSREQQIILARYGLDDAHKKTLEELAEIFGCSKQSIANQEKKALIKMRHPRNTKKLKDFLD